MKRSILIFALYCSSQVLFGQGEVPVDLFTGTPSIGIPLGSVSDHDLSDFISLSYNTKGVSVKSSTGFYGVGWSLQGGGRISREVRGLPDDLTGDTYNRVGWLYNQSNVAAQSFTSTADLSTSTCSDELNDYNYLNGLNYKIDTEPDIFYYSAGAVSGSFVFDNSSTPIIRLIPFADIKIEPVFTSNKITAFVLTTNDGVVYNFNLLSTQTYKATKLPNQLTPYVDFAKTEYEFYEKELTFNHEWALSTMVSPSGATLTYTYVTETYPSSESYDPDNTTIVRVKSRSYESYTGRYLYQTGGEYNVKKLTSVTGTNSSIQLAYTKLNTGNSDDKGALTGVTVKGLTFSKEYYFEYVYVGCGGVYNNCQEPSPDDGGGGYYNYTNYKRGFLRYITEKSGCDQLPPYEFTYRETNLDDKTTLLPPPNSVSVDFWGYYNAKINVGRTPKLYIYPQLAPAERYRVFPIAGYSGEKYVLEGSDLTANPATIQAGILYRIQYPSGGRTILEYEPNAFYDAVAEQSFLGGGLRIKSIQQQDGLNAEAQTVKSFSYTEGSNSSGRLLYKPSYAIPMARYIDPADSNFVASAADLTALEMNPWVYLTARLDIDLAPVYTGVVGYKQVKVTKSGRGYAVFEYLIPGAWGDTASGEWAPSINKFARSSACPALALFPAGGEGIFPYTRNPYNSFETGLPYRSRDYNEQGVLVKETTNTYQYLYKSGSASAKVWGIQYHKLPHTADAFYFSKYYLPTDVVKVLASQTDKIIDDQNSSKSITALTEYFYESSAHKLLTRVKKTGSDGSIYTTRMKYPLDYGTIPTGADKPAEMIGKLQTDFRNGVAVESYSTVQRTGGSEIVQGGSIVMFNDFGGTKPLLEHQLVLGGTPLTSITASSINATTKKFVYDANYEIVSTVKAYGLYNIPLSRVGMDKVVNTIGLGFSSSFPVVRVSGASPGEFAFSDFVSATGHEFSIISGAATAGGRTDDKALVANKKLQKVISKTTDRYILSGWIKNYTTAVTLTIKVLNSAGTTTYSTQTLSLTPTSVYTYFEQPVPVTASVSSFMIEVQGAFSTPSDGLYPLLDDMAFYPQHATLMSYTCPSPAALTSAATSCGITEYTVYDKLGRVTYTMDQSKNIIRKNTYSFYVPLRLLFPASLTISHLGFASPSVSVTFTAEDPCLSNVTYKWDFGSGFQTGSRIQNHTFTSVGMKTVKLKITHPTLGSKEYQTSIEIGTPD